MGAEMQGQKLAVGIVGLGNMGGAYAANLLKAGFKVAGSDPDAAARDRLASTGGTPLPSPGAVAQQSDCLLLALPSVSVLHEVVNGENGIAASLRPGTVVAEMGTLPLEAKEAVRAPIDAAGGVLLDCPVSGTGAQAAEGDLVVYTSGDQAAAEKLRPVFEAIGRDIRFVGPFGAGMKLKFVANLLVTIHNLAAAEAMLLADRSGLDLQMVYDAISAGGAATSRMFEVRGPMMVKGVYEPATMTMELYQKDLTLILDHARAVRCPVPLMAASLPYYVAALGEGRDKEDTAAVFGVLKGMTERKGGAE